MKTGTQAGRLRGPGAAGGADPGTTNTTAAEKAESAVVAEGVAPAAPEGSSQFDATHVTGEGSTPPDGGGIVAQEGVLPPGVQKDPPDWLAIAAAAEQESIAGTVEEMEGEPGPGLLVSGFFVPRLRIASRSPAGFRRCGRRWGPEPVEVDADEFTEAEILRLFAEPELMVAAVTGGLPPVVE